MKKTSNLIKFKILPFIKSKPVLVITILAVLFRIYLFVEFTPSCCGSDEGTYHYIAKNLVEKGQFIYTIQDDSLIWKDVLYGQKPPLYPIFLFLVYKVFGIYPYIVKIIQIGFSAIIGLLIYQITKEMLSKKAGIWGLIIYSFFWETAHMSLTLMSENLHWLLLSLLILLAIRARIYLINNYLIMGIILGLIILNRPASILLIPPIVIWLVWRKLDLKMFKNILILCVFCLLTLVPWTIRNYRVYGKFVFIYTDAGINFWMGNYPNSGGSYNIPNPNITGEIPTLKTSGVAQEVETNRYYFSRAIEYNRKYPLEAIDTDIRKIFRTFYLYRPIVLNETNVRGTWPLVRPKSLAIDDFWEIYASYGFATLVIFSLFGMFITFKARPKIGSIEVLLLLLFIFHLLVIAASIWTPRYVSHIYTLMIPFAAISLNSFFSHILKRKS